MFYRIYWTGKKTVFRVVEAASLKNRCVYASGREEVKIWFINKKEKLGARYAGYGAKKSARETRKKTKKRVDTMGM